jgi:hypothetical protein
VIELRNNDKTYNDILSILMKEDDSRISVGTAGNTLFGRDDTNLVQP